MKQLTILIAAFLISIAGYSQNAKLDKSGNYVALVNVRDTVGKDTGKHFTDAKGNVYPVLVSAKGKLYYMKTSKSGNPYKIYLKIEG
jgi:hypothetical protein